MTLVPESVSPAFNIPEPTAVIVSVLPEIEPVNDPVAPGPSGRRMPFVPATTVLNLG
jgi:hypothetical protein